MDSDTASPTGSLEALRADTGVICSICLDRSHTANSCPMRRRFKNSSGKLMTVGLFFETANHETRDQTAIYTLRDEDHRGLPSLYRLYMECEDLTEYEFALTYFHSWAHWQQIANGRWFQEYITRWRTELELKLKAKAIREMKAEAFAGGKNAFQAMKWIIDRGWVQDQKHGRGRPSKQEIKEAAHQQVADATQIEADFNRLAN